MRSDAKVNLIGKLTFETKICILWKLCILIYQNNGRFVIEGLY
jgi:hypothetical protein